MAIASDELGLGPGMLPSNARLDFWFKDSLEWYEFIVRLRAEVGPMTDEQAAAAETFAELAQVYEVPS